MHHSELRLGKLILCLGMSFCCRLLAQDYREVLSEVDPTEVGLGVIEDQSSVWRPKVDECLSVLRYCRLLHIRILSGEVGKDRNDKLAIYARIVKVEGIVEGSLGGSSVSQFKAENPINLGHTWPAKEVVRLNMEEGVLVEGYLVSVLDRLRAGDERGAAVLLYGKDDIKGIPDDILISGFRGDFKTVELIKFIECLIKERNSWGKYNQTIVMPANDGYAGIYKVLRLRMIGGGYKFNSIGSHGIKLRYK